PPGATAALTATAPAPGPHGPASPPPLPPPAAPPPAARSSGWSPMSLLYWRKNFFDPDRFFNWLEPKIRFVWTRGFLHVSLAAMVVAGVLLWANSDELFSFLPHALRWETLAVAWVTLVVATFCH